MNIQPLPTSQHFQMRVVDTHPLTPEGASEEVRELVLEAKGALPDLAVGQCVGVEAPGQTHLGQKVHLRLYNVAGLPQTDDAGKPRIRIAVRRCSYIDPYSGERYDGVASNYLCDRRVGDEVQLVGPYDSPFRVPEDIDANLILIATSTGIAPFRGLVRHLYEETPFCGEIWLFYGAQSGLDMIYLNEERDDFAQYYDKRTFRAFRALSPRPHFGDDIDWGDTIGSRSKELWRLLGLPNTYVYIAGLEKVHESLMAQLEKVADSPERWKRRKAELEAGGRWVELLY